MTNIKIHESWKNELLNQFNSQYMSELRVFLKEQLSSGKEIFPLESCSFKNTLSSDMYCELN